MRIPLFIEMKGKNVLVIGGRHVGLTRVRKFISAGANVTVLSLDFLEELKKLEEEGKIRLIRGDAFNTFLLENLISSSNIVVVTLNTLELNDVVIKLAKKHRAVVNLANDAENTEVVVPFEAEVNGLRIAMTSEGKSGVVVREALRRVLKFLSRDKEIADLLELMYYIKKFMKSVGVPVETRMDLYFKIFSDETFRRLVKEGDDEGAKRRAERMVRVTIS